MDKELLFYIFNLAVVVVMVVGFVYLVIISFIVQDFALIVERPLIFLIELTFMIVLPGVPLLFFSVSRGMDFGSALILASSLSVQSGLFHLVCQTSGLYRYTFGA
jgi:hypothetical protein